MKIKSAAPIFIIILASLFINLWGIAHDMPHSYEHDEINFVVTALSLGKGELNTGFIHGGFLYHFLFFEYIIFYFIKLFSGSIKTTSDFLLYYINNPEAFFLIGRISIALLATFSVFLTYLIAKGLANRFSGFLAALFLAFSLLYVIMAHLIKADIIYVLFLLLSFLCTMRGNRNKKFFYLAAFLIGLAISVKYLAVFGIFFVLSGFFLEKKSIKEIVKDCLFMCIFVIAGFFLGQPFIIFYIGTFLKAIFGLSPVFTVPIGDRGDPTWHLYLVCLKRSIGICLFIAFFLSFLLIFKKDRRKASILILPYILAYFLFIFLAANARPSYLMGVLPFVCIYTAIFIADIVSYINTRLQNTFIYSIVGFLLVAPSLIDVLRYDYLLTKPDARAISKSWIEDNIPEDSNILIEGAFPWEIVHNPPLVENIECLTEELKKIRDNGGNGVLWKARISQLKYKKVPKFFLEKEKYFNRDTLSQHNTDYVVVSSYYDHGFWAKKEDRALFYEELSKKYSLIKRFTAMPYIVWFPSFDTLKENPENLKYVNLLDRGQELIAGPNIFIYKKVK
ncbi:MAG: glycosyltransferase family 39 protein [Candidatus Gorgyraea atricola]|nr:glycosyltransferase family 39 protein [Candidatus Gorgyraea atricola]